MTMLEQTPPPAEQPLLDVKDLAQRYTLPRESMFKPAGLVHALNGVTAQVMAGRSLGVVGESGSGKSTFARLVMALEQPSSGSVSLMGRDLHRMPADELRRARRDFQMVFQDPYGSLDPRQTVARIVAEPLTALGRMDRATLRQRVAGVLRQVGLRDADMDKFPHEFSGGQRQRIAIARALITQPKLIVADEPVSALDVSVQAQVLNLMMDLQEELQLAYLFVSHDLGVVEHIGHRVAVMYLGRIVEIAGKEALFETPLHPYTQALMAAARIGRRGRREQRLGVGMQRRPEQRALVGELDDAAEIHHGDAMADVLDHAEIMRHEQVGEAELLLQIHHQVQHLGLDRHIQR